MTTVRLVLNEATRLLTDRGVADAQREAGWLLAHALRVSAGVLWAQGELPVPEAVLAEFRHRLERRAGREPIQYILGTEEFMGMVFHVSPAVLIPRLDTETLVRASASILGCEARVADIGTGSGAIAIGLASLLPRATFVATDISGDALAVAARNAAENSVADRIQFRAGDMLSPLNGERFDAILSNPPYIEEVEVADLMPEVRDWEPREALTPGPDGLIMFRRLAAGAPALLKTGGFVGVEVGAGQADAVGALFEEAGYRVTIHTDSAGIERAVVARQG